MGLDLIISLGFTFLDSRGAAVIQVSSPWEQAMASTLLRPGLHFSFHTSTPPALTYTRSYSPLRRIPLALRDDVTAELTKLLEVGIISQRLTLDLDPGNCEEEIRWFVCVRGLEGEQGHCS